MDFNRDIDISIITVLNGINEEDSKKDSLDCIMIPEKNNDINVIGVEQKNENNLSPNLRKYYKIITKYRNGEFGDECLSLADILRIADATDLLKQMSISEIQYLVDNSLGITKMMFLELKKQKTNSEDNIDGQQVVLARKKKH